MRPSEIHNETQEEMVFLPSHRPIFAMNEDNDETKKVDVEPLMKRQRNLGTHSSVTT